MQVFDNYGLHAPTPYMMNIQDSFSDTRGNLSVLCNLNKEIFRRGRSGFVNLEVNHFSVENIKWEKNKRAF